MKALHEVRNYPTGFMLWQDYHENMGWKAHWHQEIELIWVRRGTADIYIEDMEVHARVGDLVIVDTGDFHYSPVPKCKNRLDFIIFDPSLISPRYRHAHFFTPLVTSEMLAQYGLDHAIADLYATVRDEIIEEKPYYREIISAKLQDFMFRLIRLHQRNENVAPNTSHRSETLYDIQRFLAYIDEHYSEPISLTYAAETLNLSKSHFSQLFGKIIGINFISYLAMVRIEHAANMLRDSNAKVIDIALACGFTNIRSFNRCFQQYTGYTPSQFKNLPDAALHLVPFYKRKLEKREYVQGTSSVVMFAHPDKIE